MSEKKWVRRDNYISIQGWMLTDLDLKGNELIIYACIYGFSQAENQVFNGSLQYLADWTNSTKQGVTKCLKSLVEKGFIIKEDKYINGVKFCEYRATELDTVLNKIYEGMQQSLPPVQQSYPKGMQQSCNNNLPSNIPNNNQDDKTGNKKERKKSTYDEILEPIEDAELKELYYEFIKMRQVMKSPMTDRALKMLIDKVIQLEPNDIERQKKLLENAIINNWKSVYPLKDEKQPVQQKQPVSTGGNIFYEIGKEQGSF